MKIRNRVRNNIFWFSICFNTPKLYRFAKKIFGSQFLASQLGISDQQFESIFSADCDIGIRLLARAFAVLDDECYLTSRVLRYLAAREDAVDFTMYLMGKK